MTRLALIAQGLLVSTTLVACSAPAHEPENGPDGGQATADDGGGGGGGDEVKSGPVDVIVTGWPDPYFLYPSGSLPISVNRQVAAKMPIYIADAPVVVYTPGGQIASVHKTDATGHVQVTVESGALVAVVHGDHDVDATLLNVDAAFASPGDTLRFGPDVIAPAQIGQLTVSWPARVITGYTVWYGVRTPCGTFTTQSLSATIPLYQDCASGPFDVAVTSWRSSGSTSGLLMKSAVQPGANVNVSFSGATWSLVAATNVPLVNPPSDADLGKAGCSAGQYLGKMYIHGDTSSALDGACSLKLFPVASLTMQMATGYPRLGTPHSAVDTERGYLHDLDGPIDSSGSLPWITSLTYSPATREVAWTSDKPASFDASSLRITAKRSDPVTWRIYAPNGMPSNWRIPSLPSNLAKFDFVATDKVRMQLRNLDIEGVTASDLLAHSLHYDTRTFATKTTHGAITLVEYQ